MDTRQPSQGSGKSESSVKTLSSSSDILLNSLISQTAPSGNYFSSHVLSFIQKNLKRPLFSDGIYILKIMPNSVSLHTGLPASLNAILDLEKVEEKLQAENPDIVLQLVAKLEGDFYAVPRETMGQSTMTNVKFAQHVKTNDWFLIKIQQTPNNTVWEEEKYNLHRKLSPIVIAKQVRKQIEILNKLSFAKGTTDAIPIGDKEQQFLIVMKYLPGEVLEVLLAKLRKGEIQLSLEKRLNIAVSFMQQLEILKNIGFYHADLNPANIKINLETLDTNLIDYGNASPLATRMADKHKNNIPGVEPSPGTPGYRPKEALALVSEKSEVWSAGVILAELFGFAEMKHEYDTAEFVWIKSREEVSELDKKEHGWLAVFDFIQKMKTEVSNEPFTTTHVVEKKDTSTMTPEEINAYFEKLMREEDLKAIEEEEWEEKRINEALAQRPTITAAAEQFRHLLTKILAEEKPYTEESISMTQFGHPKPKVLEPGYTIDRKKVRLDLKKSPSEEEQEEKELTPTKG